MKTELSEFQKNFEKNMRNDLYKVLLDNQIKILCEKCKENFEQVKSTIIQYSPIEIEFDAAVNEIAVG